MPTNKQKNRNRRKNRATEVSTPSSRSTERANTNQQQPPSAASIMEDDIPDDVFEQFFKWSLSDKEDINSKKFKKKAPLAAEWLLTEDSGDKADERLQDKRKERLTKLEHESKMFHMDLPRKILVDSMSTFFKSEGEKNDFGQQLDATIKRLEKTCWPTLLITSAFDELAEKWSTQRGIAIHNHRYYRNNPFQFLVNFEEDKNKMIEKKSDLFQRYQEIRNETNPHDSITYMGNEVETTLFTFMGGYQHRDNCWECEQEYVSKCSGCQCAKYCSKACQVKHWKGGHKGKCKDIGSIWSMYSLNKKHVNKRMKDNRISNTCFLPPSRSIDTQLCHVNSCNMSMFSMDTFYRNMENLVDGGTHPIFGEQTINPKLATYLNMLSSDTGLMRSILDLNFLHKPIQQNETDAAIVYAMQLMSDVPSQDELYWERQIQRMQNNSTNLTIDKFLTLYAVFDFLEMQAKGLVQDKYFGEFMILTRLKDI
ncbi:hypothetical protein CTEN210_11971 [Chaetoceros tenuissimus]|uniref:MYND-type domain-containing protein n=1 Tax=Chaetoceros tenuissimus TaxID=426638 RepID=A0AAD3D2S3_9STRA|nr:hypothetical protein CTEN210_11971 [Chaetoceros tenuissimus]